MRSTCGRLLDTCVVKVVKLHWLESHVMLTPFIRANLWETKLKIMRQISFSAVELA